MRFYIIFYFILFNLIVGGNLSFPDFLELYKCKENEFRCKLSGLCINKTFLCDKIVDCGYIETTHLIDDSDETENCTKTCPKNELLCSNSTCLSISKFCDGVVDCVNDELNCEQQQEKCEKLNCEFDCKLTPDGAKCYCSAGQEVVNNTSCQDVNECEMEHEICDQICENLVNTYKCSCAKGFVRKDNRCQAIYGNETALLILTSDKLRKFTLEKSQVDTYATESTSEPSAWEKVILNLTDSSGMEIVYKDNRVCVLDEMKITCYDLFDLSKKYELSTDNSIVNFKYVTKFSYEWISNNWYLLDSHNNLIVLCSSTLTYCRVILHLSPINANKIQSIALDPNVGHMFLLKHDTYYMFAGSLQKYSLDGRNVKTLINTKISLPKEITLDIVTKRIYFLDKSYNYIQQCDYDGKNRKFLTKMFINMFSKLQYFENYFYAVDPVEHELIKIDKSKSFTKNVLLNNLEEKTQMIKIYNREIQRVDHQTCVNSQCDHMCVPIFNDTEKQFREKCFCNDGFVLNDDNKCVQNKKTKFLIYIKGNPSRIGAMSVDKFENESIIVPILEKDIHESIDVNLDDKIVYFSSVNRNKKFDIQGQNFNGTSKFTLLENLIMIRTMAYDWYGKNLFIAFTESGQNYKISAVKLNKINNDNNTAIKTLVKKDIDIPFSITLDVEEGKMYWSSWTDKYGKGGRIESAWMDGTNRKLVIEHDSSNKQLYWPRSLTLHKKENKLFYIDVLRETIESIKLDASGERKEYDLGNNLNPFALTILDDVMYMLIDANNSINLYFSNLSDSSLSSPTKLPVNCDKMTFIKGISKPSSTKIVDNKNITCPGLLLMRPVTAICVCSDGHSLNAKGTDCVPSITNKNDTEKIKINCPEEQFRCASGDECIDLRHFCDDYPHCTDGSDESDKNCEKACSFRCDNLSRCLSMSHVCDSKVDCIDESDEDPEHCLPIPLCTDKSCSPEFCDEFHCANGNCVDFNLVCDRENNCGDNSDEINCDYDSLNSTEIPNREDLNVSKITETCEYPDLLCPTNKKCVPVAMVCDGNVDCEEDHPFDEFGKCREKQCDVYNDCEYFCQNSPFNEGYFCHCPSNMFLKPDRKSCQLKQNCDKSVYICNQLNTTELLCHYYYEYRINNGSSSCEIMNFLVADKESFQSLNMLEVSTYPYQTVQLTSADVNRSPNNTLMYWEDIKTNEVKRAEVPIIYDDSYKEIETIIDSSYEKFGEIEILWDFDLIYFVQKKPKKKYENSNHNNYYRLMVSNLKGEHSAIVLNDLNKVISFTVSRDLAKIFLAETYTEDEFVKYSLRQCDLDGLNLETLFISNHMIEYISLDQQNHRLYYTQNRTLFFYDLESKVFKSLNIIINEGETSTDIEISCLRIYEKDIFIHKNCSKQFKKCNDKLCHSSPIKNTKKIKFLSKNYRGGGSNVCSSKPCEHLCIPSKAQSTGYTCLCSLGFKKVLFLSCTLDDDILYYSDGHHIRGLILENHSTIDAIPPMLKFDDISRIDVDNYNNIYISDKENGEILKMAKDGTHREKLFNQEKIFENTLLWLGDMAVDWESHNVYITDQRHGFIEVSKENGQYRLIITTDLYRPYLIALDPESGLLFVIDGYFKIFRQTMDGGKNKLEINKDLKKSHIFDFALDTSQKLLFWCDHNSNFVGKIDYDGNNYEKIELTGPQNPTSLNPISLDALNNRLYWLEEHSGAIKRMLLSNRSDILTIKERNSVVPLNFRIYYKLMKGHHNSCGLIPALNGCEHLCLFNGTHANCRCAMGKLDKDGFSCKTSKDYLVYANHNSVYRLKTINQDKDQYPEKLTNTNTMKNISALAYDFESTKIFASDLYTKGIYSVGKNMKKIVENQTNVQGLAIHPLEKLLLWTVGSEAEIRSLNLNTLPNNLTIAEVTNYVRIIIKLKKDEDKLRAIAVEVCINMIYFTNLNSKRPSIQRAYITGYGRENIISKDIVMPSALALDYDAKKLYWTDTRLDKIEYCNYDGTKRVVLLHTAPKHPFGITVFENYLYWTDWFMNKIYRVNKRYGHDTTSVNQNIRQPLALLATISLPHKCISTKCSLFNGGCEDVCLPHENDEVKCECTQGVLNQFDKTRCQPRIKEVVCNTTSEFECKSGECVPYTLTCDDTKHCMDGSDENLIFCTTRKCPTELYFQCRNSQCILKSEYCNNHIDCSDGSDEDSCECTADEFRCTSGECISDKLRCDFDPDCKDASDEMNCSKRNCSNEKLPYELKTKMESVGLKFEHCPFTTACYLETWLCDGENDCWDHWDERDCDNATKKHASCGRGKFRCSNGNCIPSVFQCDGEDDCKDVGKIANSTDNLSSDEKNCQRSCRPDQFGCNNSSICIPLSFVCDGVFDCPDKTDEEQCNININKNKTKNCEDDDSCTPIKCEDYQFKCHDQKECINTIFVCDGDFDCGDGSDEHKDCNTMAYNRNLTVCALTEFTCENNECISKDLLCNLEKDCSDGSDEKLSRCLNTTLYCGLDPNNFKCKVGGCIGTELVCNGENDCGDFSDEEKCNINECEFDKCDQVCTDLKIGYKCSCNPGYVVNQEDPSKCDDYDECLDKSCPQICLNTRGSYKCECLDGFVKHSHSRCKIDSDIPTKFLFSNRYYIRSTDFYGDVEIVLHNLSNVVAIDYDWRENFLYYSDVTATKSVIARVKLFSSDTEENFKKEVLHQQNLLNPDGLAFDWVASNLYFADKGRHVIEVSASNGRFRKGLIVKDLDEPRAIALDPYNKYMYWSDWGKKPHIGRAGMDGSSPKHLIADKKMGWPNALTICFDTNELFYGDAREDYIAVYNLKDGTSKILMSRANNPSLHLHHIFSIAVWEDRLYWTDWEMKSIESCDKYAATNCFTVVQTIHRPMDLLIHHPFRQSKLKKDSDNVTRPYNTDNPCMDSGCAGLCLLKPEPPYYTCACPDYFYLGPDQKSCIANCTSSQFLCEKSLRCIPFYWQCDTQIDCPLENGTAEDESDACPKNRFCRPGQFQCAATKEDQSNFKCIPPKNICDGVKHCPNGDDENCENFECFSESEYKCEKSLNKTSFCIDGSKRCNKHLDCPNGDDEKDCPALICLAEQFKCEKIERCISKIWICDGDSDCEDGSDERGCSDRVCNNDEYRCQSGRCIPMTWKCDGEIDCMEDGDDEGIKANCGPTEKVCAPTYFRCNDSKCIPGRWKCDYEKDCEDGSDEVNCAPRNCSESEFRCNDGRCIKGVFKCDGEYNCKDMSDELECEVLCDDSSFKCEKDRTCIKKNFICDNDPDCSDFSDEKNCTCKNNEFKCGGEIPICIMNEFLCDGILDCPNGADEEDSRCLSRSCSGNAKKCLNGKCISSFAFCDKVKNCEHDHKDLKCNYGDNSNNVCKFGTCSQVCIENYNNGTEKYYCKCAPGYQKIEYGDNKALCLAQSDFKSIFTASESKLRFMIDSHRPIFSYIQTSSLKILNFDYILQGDDLTIVWLESMPDNNIYRLNVNTKTDFSDIKNSGIKGTNAKSIKQPKTPSSLKSLAIDWISWKIYTIENYMINVLDFDGKNEKTILYGGMYPVEIILDLESKQVIWSSLLRSINIASMDGENSRTLLSEDVEFASGMAIDYPSKRLWWCDVRKSTIETSLLDGSDRHVIRKFDTYDSNGILISPKKLDIFEEDLYVVFTNKSILMMNKQGSKLTEEVSFTGPYIHKASNIKVIHSLAKLDYENPCKLHKCHESAICLLSAVQRLSRACTCPNNLYIQKNGTHVQCVERYQIPTLCTKKCFNSGKCKFVNKKETCVCSPKYNGENCENYICSEYCVHGVCILPPENLIGNLTSAEMLRSRKCKCKDQWAGERCTVPVKPCQNGTENCKNPKKNNDESVACLKDNYCKNNGVCKMSSNGVVSCKCVGEWNGPNCTVPPLCISDECGTCNPYQSINECLCKNGLIQPCLIADSDITVDPNKTSTDHEILTIVLSIIVVIVISASIAVLTVMYLRKHHRLSRFFTHSRMSENTEEISNPIFDYTEADDNSSNVQSNFYDMHLVNPVYESMYPQNTFVQSLLDQSEEEDVK